jgi:antitoxin component YwqK of YwqJK toxin-antitoxin module
MILPATLSLLVLLALVGYRWRWLRRYGRSGVDGSFTRLQGTIEAAGGADVVLSRSGSGELWRRPFALRLASGALCSVDPRSPWLRLVGQKVRCGELCTVDGLIAMRARAEALYRESSQAPALEALRVTPGAWPELRLLRLAAGAALLTLIAALAVPVFVQLPAQAPPPRTDEPQPDPGARLPPLDCAADTDATCQWPERWCQRVGAGRHGPWEMHDHEGNLLARGQYVENKRQGPFVRFGNNGRLMRSSRFLDDREEGCTERWTYEGALESRLCYHEGELDGRAAVWDRGLRERGSYRRGRKHGRWEAWSPDGVLLRAGEYRDGQREGPWRFWNEDGGVAARGSYHDGELHGLWRWWHDTGVLAGEGRYGDGEKTGCWRSFYPGGGRQAQIDYRKGEITDEKRWEE